MAGGSARSGRGAGDASVANPTLRRWELAARLRELRHAAGRSVDEVAAELMCSAAKISRMETAGRGVQQRDIRDLCRFYGLSDTIRDELMLLAEEAKRPGWWQEFRTVDEQTITFVGLEAAAIKSCQFVALFVPALLQTSDYVRSLVTGVRRAGHWEGADLEQIIEMRDKRQQRLLEGDLHLHAIVDEAALRRSVGSPSVMSDQIRHLRSMAERDNVTLQIVPFVAGPHPGIDGSFKHLQFPPGALADVVLVEGLLGSFILDKPAEVERYLGVFSFLESSVALSAEDTITWLDAWRMSTPPSSREGVADT